MKPSKFIACLVSIILALQVSLCFYVLCKKAVVATDDSLPVLELRIGIPYLHRRGDNFCNVSEQITFTYNEEDPLVEKLDFTRTTGDRTQTLPFISFPKRTIYLPLSQEGDKLSLNGYSTKKPSEGYYLTAIVSRISKPLDKDRITISPSIVDLQKFNFEGDKWDSIRKHLDETRKFNSALDRKRISKEITQKEYNQQSKKAHLNLRLDTEGNFFILDCIVDDKSLRALRP